MSNQLTLTSDAEKMAALTKGTTKEQWERYYADLKAHEERYEREKPKPTDYEDLASYDSAFSRWLMNYSCNMPNKPGYYRANND